MAPACGRCVSDIASDRHRVCWQKAIDLARLVYRGRSPRLPTPTHHESQIPNPDSGRAPYNARRMDRRAAAFARLFEAVHEGVYIGTIGTDSSATIAANPHLKLIFGYPSEEPEPNVRPFDRDRFVDPQARIALLERLTSDGSVNDYLLRLRRADGNPVWIELTARADPPADDHSCRVEALVRDVSERKKLDDETR